MRNWVACGLAASGVIGLCASSGAAPPPDADPALAGWFESLIRPGTNQSCCGVADCRRVRYRIAGDHFQAYIGQEFPRWTNAPDAWVDVPEATVVHRRDNPTGEAVACWFEGEILCFVPASGT